MCVVRLQYVISGVWFVARGIWYVVCGMWYLGCGMRYVICAVVVICSFVVCCWYVVCGVWYVVCGALYHNVRGRRKRSPRALREPDRGSTSRLMSVDVGLSGGLEAFTSHLRVARTFSCSCHLTN